MWKETEKLHCTFRKPYIQQDSTLFIRSKKELRYILETEEGSSRRLHKTKWTRASRPRATSWTGLVQIIQRGIEYKDNYYLVGSIEQDVRDAKHSPSIHTKGHSKDRKHLTQDILYCGWDSNQAQLALLPGRHSRRTCLVKLSVSVPLQVLLYMQKRV